MDGEQKPQKDIDAELREAIGKELASFTNSKSEIAQTPASKAAEIANSSSIENLIKNVSAPQKTEKEVPNISSLGNFSEQTTQAPIRRPIVRTYKSDVEETIQTGHISSVNIAVAEHEKMRDRAIGNIAGENKSGINKNILILSIVLVLGGALAILIPYFLVQKQAAPAPAKVETVPSGAFLAADVEEKINIKNINLNRFPTTLKERVDQSALTLGQIKNIYFTEGDGVNEKIITADKFLTLLGANVPPEISRTLRPEYMFGMYSYNGTQRFLILRVGSYDTTFAGMLSWEVTLWQDFKETFGLKSEDTASGTPATGTPASISGLEVKKFEDASFDNKDDRVVRDSTGKIIFLYSIIDNNTVVIATSQNTMHEIISRMGAGKVTTQ
jgi:hypothetical protein